MVTAAQETIVRTGSIAAAVLSLGDQLALVELTGKPDAVTQATALIKAGFVIRGIAGIVNGQVATAANDPLNLEDQFNMGRAARMFGLLVSKTAADDGLDLLRRKLTAPPEPGDSAEWLKSLYQLQDPRKEN
jgi:hypothetical protein